MRDPHAVTLQAQATTQSDSMIAHLRVWLDLRYGDGRKVKWASAAFPGDLRVIQEFLESYGGDKALSRRAIRSTRWTSHREASGLP